jgi:hypothetical protein
VREEGSPECLDLRRLVLGARRQVGVALHPHRVVGEEGRAEAPALEPGDDARGARVEHRDADIGRHALHRLPQLPVRQGLAPEHEARLVGVAGVVEDHLHSGSLSPCPFGTGPDEREGLQEGLPRRVLQGHAVVGRQAPEAGHHRGEALGVGDGIAQRHPLGGAAVAAGHEGQPARVRPGLEGRREGQAGDEGEPDQGRCHRGPSFRSRRSTGEVREGQPHGPSARRAETAGGPVTRATSNGIGT